MRTYALANSSTTPSGSLYVPMDVNARSRLDIRALDTGQRVSAQRAQYSPKRFGSTAGKALLRRPRRVSREGHNGHTQAVAVLGRPERGAILRVEHGDQVGYGGVDLRGCAGERGQPQRPQPGRAATHLLLAVRGEDVRVEVLVLERDDKPVVRLYGQCDARARARSAVLFLLFQKRRNRYLTPCEALANLLRTRARHGERVSALTAGTAQTTPA